ncbi:MAG: hypothetical protein MUF64_11175 [Polyangiaceae bacterium]|jgi:hypothetical protein|nr:hypothetical protein [Polyangiaceae bacterium]
MLIVEILETIGCVDLGESHSLHVDLENTPKGVGFVLRVYKGEAPTALAILLGEGALHGLNHALALAVERLEVFQVEAFQEKHRALLASMERAS